MLQCPYDDHRLDRLKDLSITRGVSSVLMKDDESKERWGLYVNMLMNKENQRVETE